MLTPCLCTRSGVGQPIRSPSRRLRLTIMDCIVQNDFVNNAGAVMARPREFDADIALDRALELFWSKGYEASSLDELCDATGLSRSSLYATFGSKRNLLLRTVDRYFERRTPRIAEALARPLPICARHSPN